MFHREDRTTKSGITVLLVVLFSAIVFAFGYSIGSTTRIDELRWGGADEGDTPADVAEEVDFTTFWDVWDLVSEKYIDQPVDKQTMLDGAIEGMVAALGDPYSTYFTPQLAEEFRQEVNQKFFGIGAEIGEREETITVIAPLAGTPAEAAGVLAGDFILAVDGEDTAGMTVEEAVKRIRGDKGTQVVLTLYRGGEPFDVTITRAEITVDSVKWTMRDDGIAVITISVFNEDTVGLFRKATEEILDQHPRGAIIDLRNDPGGLLTAAIDVASFWTGKDVVVIEETLDGETPFGGNGTPVLAGMPTVVLVNAGSASASEILAGALQDYGYATIMGEQTFGKGSVQEYHEGLAEGAAVKITVAHWLTPKGRTISDVGITPDVVVEETIEDFHAGKTPQMDAAVRQLTQN